MKILWCINGCKNVKIQQALQEKWNEIVTKRGYFAVVEGVMDKPEGTFKTYLKKNSQNLMYSSKNLVTGSWPLPIIK